MGEPLPIGDPTSLAGQRLGRYEVLTQLASGGMATVYIARAQGVAGFERLVAVKVMHPHMAYEEEFIQMFLDEARLAARIRHPNVVPTLDISDTDGRGFYLVMDYVEGDHLGALLRGAVTKRERLDPRVAVRVVLDALAGLAAAHNLIGADGQPLVLVHRDVSPHNILVGADGVSRLTDFGVAKAEVRLSSTRDGQFKGKLGYMAPEHASTGLADQRSDIFSMGIVLWECLASKRLFRGENNAATLSKILNMPVPLLANEAPELAPFDPVLGRVLARPPEERYQSANEFLEALEQACLDGNVPPASPRLVAAAVIEHAGEKIEAEKSRIKEAIATYGASSLAETPLPRPSDGSSSRTYRKEGVHGGRDVATMAARPATVADRATRASPDGGAKRWVAPAVVIAALVALAGIGTALWLGQKSSASEEQGTGFEVEVFEGNAIDPREAAAEPAAPVETPNPQRPEAPEGAESGAEAQRAPPTEVPVPRGHEEPQGAEEPESAAITPSMRHRGMRGGRRSMATMGQAGGMEPTMAAPAMMTMTAQLNENPYVR